MADVNNVTVGKPRVGGAVYRAPAGTTLPTDASTALASAFVSLGYVSDDGLTNTTDVTNEEIKAWGGDTVMNSLTEFSDTFKFTSIEALNVDVLKAFFGDANVTGTLATGITVNAKGVNDTSHVWVFDMIMRNNALKRIVIPNGEVTEKGDTVYSDDEPVGYEITISALPDSSGNTHYEYIKAASNG